MNDDDLSRAHMIALRATVQAIATYLRDALPKEEVQDLIDRATSRAREDAPPELRNAAGNAVTLFFAKV